MSSFDSIIDYIHHRLHSSIDHVILFMDTQINQWPHNKVHMSLSQGRGFRSDINRGVNGCHCHDRPYHGKFMFYQWIEIFNLTWWPKQNVYCRPWVSWYIYFILWSHILTHSQRHTLTSKLNDMVTTHCPLCSLMSRRSCTLATLGMLTSTIKLAISSWHNIRRSH
jgi:hypothetical protein